MRVFRGLNSNNRSAVCGQVCLPRGLRPRTCPRHLGPGTAGASVHRTPRRRDQPRLAASRASSAARTTTVVPRPGRQIADPVPPGRCLPGACRPILGTVALVGQQTAKARLGGQSPCPSPCRTSQRRCCSASSRLTSSAPHLPPAARRSGPSRRPGGHRGEQSTFPDVARASRPTKDGVGLRAPRRRPWKHARPGTGRAERPRTCACLVVDPGDMRPPRCTRNAFPPVKDISDNPAGARGQRAGDHGPHRAAKQPSGRLPGEGRDGPRGAPQRAPDEEAPRRPSRRPE